MTGSKQTGPVHLCSVLKTVFFMSGPIRNGFFQSSLHFTATGSERVVLIQHWKNRPSLHG